MTLRENWANTTTFTHNSQLNTTEETIIEKITEKQKGKREKKKEY